MVGDIEGSKEFEWKTRDLRENKVEIEMRTFVEV
jgi:hypothetical protein